MRRGLKLLALALAAACAPSTGTGAGPGAAPAVREGFVETRDGVRIFWRAVGSGPDTVVVLHGGPALNLEYLEPNLGPLARGRTVLYYDQYGGGRSVADSVSPKSVEVEYHVADLEALRVHFGLERLTLLGHSWGSLLAGFYAVAHPERVERLVLVGPMPPADGPMQSRFNDELAARLGPEAKARADALRYRTFSAEDPAAACREYYRAVLPAYFADSTRLPLLRGDVCSVPAWSVRAQAIVSSSIRSSLRRWNVVPGLAAVRAPTLVVAGVGDPTPPESPRAWAAALPDARLLVIEGGGHFPFVEQPGVFFPAVDRFLRGRWPPGAVRVEGG